MKRVLFLVMAILLYSISIAQKAKKEEELKVIFPEVDGIVNYTDVVKVDSANKSNLYITAKKWFVATYKSAKDVLQLDDREAGELIGKGIFYTNLTFLIRTYEVTVNHTIKISVKDGRYKYQITDIRADYKIPPIPGRENGTDVNLEIDNAKGKVSKSDERARAQIHLKILLLIESLKTSMSKPQNEAAW